ncbi:hypothetical protein ACIQWN_37900 [Streptomyces vinaceus]|uniref:hypothetical protein n=1 Tax=Streptomyces vinaceus TaxID=1960 RepID=UPI00380ADCB5
MTDDEIPEGEAVLPFAVPITGKFAEAAAGDLKSYRKRAENGFPGGPPAATSPFMTDIETMRAMAESEATARMSLHSMLIDIVGLSFDTALDHVRALEHDIVRDPAPVWSPLVSARAVLESCLFLEYLIDPSISCGLRLARCAGLWRKDTDHATKAARVFGPEQQAGAANMDTYVTRALKDAKVLECHNAKGTLVGYKVDGAAASLDFSITERARTALPAWIPMPYGLLSGAAHSRPWMTDRARKTGMNAGSGLVGEAATVMTALMVAMASLEMSLKAWQGYFGCDLAETLTELEEHRRQGRIYLLAMAHAVES